MVKHRLIYMDTTTIVCNRCGKCFQSKRGKVVCESCSKSCANVLKFFAKSRNPHKKRIPTSSSPIKHDVMYHNKSHTVHTGSHTKYCDKFDNACRERIRNKYDRVCFYCGKDEYTNNAKLSVHHLDMNKDQGCNGHEWRLVPLCRTCHGKAHTDTMTAKLKAMYAQIAN